MLLNAIIWDKAQSVSRMIAENPQLAELWARGSKAGLAKLNDADRVQFVNFLTYVLRIWEELFLQHRRGLIDEDVASQYAHRSRHQAHARRA